MQIREIDLAEVGPPGALLRDWAVLIASNLVLELGGLDSVQAALPTGQAELVAAEVEQLALEIDAPGPLALAVVRRPFRPGWAVLELAIVDGEPLRR
jgi:hypothetical protein